MRNIGIMQEQLECCSFARDGTPHGVPLREDYQQETNADGIVAVAKSTLVTRLADEAFSHVSGTSGGSVFRRTFHFQGNKGNEGNNRINLG